MLNLSKISNSSVQNSGSTRAFSRPPAYVKAAHLSPSHKLRCDLSRRCQQPTSACLVSGRTVTGLSSSRSARRRLGRPTSPSPESPTAVFLGISPSGRSLTLSPVGPRPMELSCWLVCTAWSVKPAVVHSSSGANVADTATVTTATGTISTTTQLPSPSPLYPPTGARV
ncbi:unnamed protein product [Protopolystoma xenopodis]|uniref:Uncharacterized protein n=1 Tax=Protopolystoma xenopodis TaxID=117903 RepID=A0A448XP97_9PLAT|nr:unnamed protein product [Protopolystoma xenopodis]